MNKKNKIYSFLLIGGAILYNFTNLIQISYRQFFNEFLSNTTQIDLYGDRRADIYLNNNTKASHFIILKNNTNITFEDILLTHNYTSEIFYKVKKNNMFDTFMMFGLLTAFITYIKGSMFSGFSRCVQSDDNVSVKLENVAGLKDAKVEIFEFVDFLKNREKYIKIGAKMPRGALLYGPPGTGKTLLAKAIAGECKVPFISVSGTDFSEMFVGVGAARVRNLFQNARSKAPCIVFIDEIDALARKRGQSSSSSHHEKDNTLNRLLIELDGFDPNDNILIFGATNRLDILDKALLRPGRFDRKIQFELPECKDREAIFEYYLNKLQIEGDPHILALNLAKQSFGFSGADIYNVCNEASILAIRNKAEMVTTQYLEQALEYVLLGPKKTTFQLSEKEKRIVAYHESGHTLLSRLLPHAKNPIKVSILPRGKSALGFSQSEMSDAKLRNKDEILDSICVLLGGRMAEELFCENITTGASDDIQKLTELSYHYVTIYGMEESVGTFHYEKERKYSEKLHKKIDKAVLDIIQKSYARAKKLIQKNRHLIEILAKTLLEKETLIVTDLDEIFK